MEINKVQNKVHTVNIFDRVKIEVVGAVEVLSSTEKEVVAKLENMFLHIFGSGLTVSKLVPEEQLLVVSGTISGLKYEGKQTKKSFLGKVFK